MSPKELDQDARASQGNLARDREKIAEAVERELTLLREARPHLESRIDRAAGLLVVQLSSPPRTRPIRVRVRKDGKRVFLVDSLSSGGAVYEVDPAAWSCSCPDHHRRDQACKHVVSSYVLKRAAREASGARKGCRVCVDGWVYMGEEVVDSESGEVVTALNPRRCRRCTPVEPPHLTDEEMREWMASVRWHFAKTMPDHPHEYTLKREQDPELFDRVARTIWELGYDRKYLNRPWRTLDVGEHYYCWVWTKPSGPRAPVPPDTILVNRAQRSQERIV